MLSRPATPPGPDQLAHLVVAVGSTRDRDAFAELFGYFAPRIKAYLVKRGAGAAQAEELAQEAMIMVWRRAASFDPAKAAASTWIFTIARNKRIDALRREGRPEYDPAEYDPADPGLPAVQGASEPKAADRMVEMAQQAEALARAIDDLPDEQAALVRMAYFEDKAHGQIAAETALPLGTVKSRLRLALGRLRKSLNTQGEI